MKDYYIYCVLVARNEIVIETHLKHLKSLDLVTKPLVMVPTTTRPLVILATTIVSHPKPLVEIAKEI
jgi:hypothetical protein